MTASVQMERMAEVITEGASLCAVDHRHGDGLIEQAIAAVQAAYKLRPRLIAGGLRTPAVLRSACCHR